MSYLFALHKLLLFGQCIIEFQGETLALNLFKHLGLQQ